VHLAGWMLLGDTASSEGRKLTKSRNADWRTEMRNKSLVRFLFYLQKSKPSKTWKALYESYMSYFEAGKEGSINNQGELDTQNSLQQPIYLCIHPHQR